MRRLLLLFLILPIVHSACPDGFKLVADGQCAQLTPISISLKNNEAGDYAISKCKENHTQPVIIHSDNQQSYWQNVNYSNRIILGILCNTSSWKWQWSDGTQLDYTPSSHSTISTCNLGCVWYLHAGTWYNYCNSDSNSFNIYCSTQLPHPVYTEDGCELFSDDTDDGLCYKIGEDAETWNDAQMNCKKVGANLASIHSDQENNFVRRLAVSNQAVSGLFLGATISGKENNFGWIDGSAWDYTNFYQGFPMPGFGDCVAMDTSTSAGQWMNFNCGSKLPVACSREKKSNIPTNSTCSSGPWAENTLITSPGFPYNASIPCDYFLMAEDGKNVELEIVHLEANSCCDHLELYDGYLGATLMANVTGAVQNVTYTTKQTNFMRVSWQPQGGVNVMGLAMTFRSV